MTRDTTIHCTRSLRNEWPNPLAQQWRVSYPQLFDDDDFRLTQSQSWTHFWEWFAAIHIYHRDGAYSLVEKYGCRSHSAKQETYESIMADQERQTLDRICGEYHVQSPDLLAYLPDFSRYWFVEVKGPGDRLSPGQTLSHEAIERDLGVTVEVMRVDVDGDA